MPRPFLPRRGTRVSALFVLLGLTACGSDSPTDGGDGTPALALSSAVANLTGFEGGPDASSQIDVTNGGTGSLTGLSTSVDYEAGQPTGWLTAALSGTTAPATLELDADLSGLAVGRYDATVDVSANGVGSPETIEVTLMLDLSSPPVIEITSPTRAAMLMEGTNDPYDVQITGQACHDAVPIEVLTVNSEAIPVTGTNLCESFDVTQSSAWGLSVVEVHAENGYGRAAELVQSYLRSPEYMPAAFTADAAARVPRGIFSRLNDQLIDDGDRSDFDDIGTVVEAWVDAFDLNEGIPTTSNNPSDAGQNASENCVLYTNTYKKTGIRLTRGDLSGGARFATLAATNSGLEIAAGIDDVSATVAARGWQHVVCTPSITASQTGDLDISDLDASMVVNADLSGSAVNTTVVSSTADVSGLEVDVDWGILDFLDFLINGLVSLFDDAISDGLEAAIENFLLVGVPSVVEEFIESFEVDATGTINGAEVAYDGPLDFLDFGGSGGGYADLGLALQVYPIDSPVHDGAPVGAIQVGGATPSFLTTYEIGIGVADDHVNQVLWAAWQAGSFEVDDIGIHAGGSYPGLQGSVSPSLPPVVATSSGGHHVDVQWGDLIFTGFADPTEFGLPAFQEGDSVAVTAHVTVIAGVDIAFDTGLYSLTGIVGTPDVRVAVTTEVGALIDEAALATAIEGAITDFVTSSLPAALTGVQLPEIDLSGQQGVPAGTVIRLESATVERAGRYTTLTGSVGN